MGPTFKKKNNKKLIKITLVPNNFEETVGKIDSIAP